MANTLTASGWLALLACSCESRTSQCSGKTALRVQGPWREVAGEGRVKVRVSVWGLLVGGIEGVGGMGETDGL